MPLSEFRADKALVNLNADYWGHTPKDDAKGLVLWAGKRTVGDPGDTVKSYYERYHRICETYQKS